MEFIWSVKNNVPLFERVEQFVCKYIYLSLIHTQKFPEIVGFSRKRKITHILKIMNRVNFIYGQHFIEMYTFVAHGILAPFLHVRRIPYVGDGPIVQNIRLILKTS